MYNDSATYAGQVNARVDAVQSTINDGLFGWVNSTTTTLNETVNTFYTDVQNLVDTVFGNTILDEPGQSEANDEADSDATQEATLGTMLAQLGIPAETLGWNDQEGDFLER